MERHFFNDKSSLNFYVSNRGRKVVVVERKVGK